MSSDEAPERIYLQVHPDDADEGPDWDDGSVTWCSDPIHDTDVEFIRSDLRLSPETVERIRKVEFDMTVTAGIDGGYTDEWVDGFVWLLRDILKECGENEDEQ